MSKNEKVMFERFASGENFVVGEFAGVIRKIEKTGLQSYLIEISIARPGRSDLNKWIDVDFQELK